MSNTQSILSIAKRTLETESKAIENLIDQLDDQFAQRGMDRAQRMEEEARNAQMKSMMGGKKLAELELERRQRNEQERAQGGPEAKQIQRDQLEENAA